jgi:hypothetical protein
MTVPRADGGQRAGDGDWVWSCLDDWIDGVPGETTRALLRSRGPGHVPDDLLLFLGPSLIGDPDPALRSAGLQLTSSEMIQERAQREAILEVSGRWSSIGLAHVFVKGADFRHRLYQDPHRRRSNDIDVLCAPIDRRRAVDELTDMGFDLVESSDAFLDGRSHEVATRRGDVSVDLHVSMLQPDRARVDVPAILGAAESVTLDGGTIPVAERHHALALALIHIGRHEAGTEYVGIKHGLDVALAFERWRDLDWSVIARAAREWNCFRLAAVGLWCWAPSFGARIPPDASLALDPGSTVRWLAGRAQRMLRSGHGPDSRSSRLAQLGLKFAFAEGWRQRGWLLRELWRRARPRN